MSLVVGSLYATLEPTTSDARQVMSLSSLAVSLLRCSCGHAVGVHSQRWGPAPAPTSFGCCCPVAGYDHGNVLVAANRPRVCQQAVRLVWVEGQQCSGC